MSDVIEALSFVCLVGGALFCAIGGFGMLRMPDLYTRTHAATITDTLGAGLVLVGLMLQGGFTNVTLKLVMVLLFIYFTSPVAGHALVKAAFSSGLRAKLAPEAPRHPQTTRPPRPGEQATQAVAPTGDPTAAPADDPATTPPKGGDDAP